MKQLTCEMCGSTDLVKQDGMFVCQTCGTKYSVEEAKKMMVEGTVRIDNSHLIDNYLTMAENAYQSKNQTEAESYCNKIIEIDPNNYKAWGLKGKAAGWSSTLQNLRFPEAVSAFSKSLLNAPEEVKKELVEEYKNEITDLAIATINLRADRFKKYPDEDETHGFFNDLRAINDAILSLCKQNKTEYFKDEQIWKRLAEIVDESVNTALVDVIIPDYKGEFDRTGEQPGKYEFEKFYSRVVSCITLMETAIEICTEDDESDIKRYNLVISLYDTLRDSAAYDFEYETDIWGNYYKRWYETYTVSNDMKTRCNQKINEYQQEIKKIEQKIANEKAAEKAAKEKAEREAAEKRFTEYWQAHAEDKIKYEEEIKQLKEEIKTHESAIEAIVGEDEKRICKNNITTLEKEKKSLGIFKIKEKKAVQEKIDNETQKLNGIIKRMESEKNVILRKITTLQSRIDSIEKELKKPR